MAEGTPGRLPRDFYRLGAVDAAPALLGKMLVRRTPEGRRAGIIVETEAYVGSRDKGAHAYPNKRTPRTQVQFGPGGFAYVYQVYGAHFCLNVVTAPEGVPDVVLVRALEPVEGLDQMARRRGTEDPLELCSGPGKLCRAMDIGREQYGCDLCGEALWLEAGRAVAPEDIRVSPRIHIDYAEEYRDVPWRFFLGASPFVSRVERRYRALEEPFCGKLWGPQAG